ncbi:MAG: sensor histidine kinase [Lautropia sp.]
MARSDTLREGRPLVRPQSLRSIFSDLVRMHETRPDTVPRVERRRRPRPDTDNEPYQRRSLYAEILDFMFAPLALLWPVSVAITFIVARSLADAPFDRALEERMRTLINYVEVTRSFQPPGGFNVPSTLFPSSSEEPNEFQIVSSRGTVLAGAAALPRPRIYDFPELDRIKRRTVTHRGEDWRVAYAYVQPTPGLEVDGDAPLLLQVAETLEQRTALANEILRGIIVPQFLTLPLAVFLVWFGLARGLKPLKAVQERIRNRATDDFSPIDPRGAAEEIAPLVTAFNDLLARLEKNIDSQKRFIGDAAHQLKTPLAGLRMQAELALQESEPHELRSRLRLIASSAERSAHMVSQLLALARTENLREAAPFATIDLCELARSVVGEWVPQSLARGIDLGFEQEVAKAPIDGHEVLLRELLNNLIDNALRHAPDGAVTVRIRTDRDQVVLDVEDNGCGIAPDEQGRIFDRFYRVLGNTTEGSGLGLAIVKEIADQHGARLTLTSPLPGIAGGTRFSLAFGPEAEDPDDLIDEA